MLSARLVNFLDEYNSKTSTNYADEPADQRHFFDFPDSEQFRCSITRPAVNLIFANGKLSKFLPT